MRAELTDKPGSVGDNHSSSLIITYQVKRLPEISTSSTIDFCLPCSGWSLPCHELLPAVRWALTPPFQPYLISFEPSAVYFLLHLSSAHAVQTLSGTLLYGARTFLCSNTAIVWLTQRADFIIK